jgi:ectoine hydroxylase-related dioxygenase (phytanoyl-CoA dioxygenase family)
MRPTIAQLAQDPETWVDTFRLDGFVGPVALLDPADAWRLLAHIRTTVRQNPRAWYKNLAPIDHKLHWLATRPDLISVLRKLLGNDIVLSGAHVITRPPGESHPWHTDSESAAPDSRFVTVWLGLDNTSRESAFQLISRSHTIGKPIQQLRHEFGRKREEVTTEEVLGWARERIPDAQHVWSDISDGEAIIVDGRLWHTTENHRSRGRRSALVLQYADADTPIR